MSLRRDTVDEEILRFELMLQATESEQRSEGCNGLEGIAQRWQGTRYARKAKQIIESKCHPATGGVNDPELSAFSKRRIEIHKLNDPRLPDFLRDLQTKPATAARIRRELIKDLKDWISEALPRVGSQMSPEEIDSFNRFAALSTLKTYESELDELRQLRHALFELRYREVHHEIIAALKSWSFDTAWSALQQLDNPPASFQTAVTQLQDDIYKANKKHQEVNQLLDRSPEQEPAGWTRASSAIDYVEELSGYLDEDVPEPWRKRLSSAKEQSVAGIVRFLETKATPLRELNELRAFRAKFDDLRSGNRGADISLRKEWFQSALDQLKQCIEKEVVEAESPEALDVILMGLIEKQDGLPDVFIEELGTWRIHIEEISASWKVIRTGDDFPAHMPSAPLPEAFVTAVEFFKKRLDRVKHALTSIETSPTDVIQTFIEAGQTAKEILAELGSHSNALKLKEKAERKIAYHQIYSAIARWQIDRLVRLCRQRKQETECGYYLANEDLLRGLEELTNEVDFSGFQEAAGWWQLWRARTSGLPAIIPEALNEAIRIEQENRADQWHALLARASEDSLPPEKWEEIAASLKHELARLDLKWRQKIFLHKAGAGYAERFIESKQWSRAEEQIARLDQEQESTRWLKTLLSVERARDAGVAALANVLKSDWSQVSLYLEADAYSILIAAVANAWEEKEDEALRDLRLVVTRLLATQQAPAEVLKTLRQWEEWLTVENYVRTTGGLAAVKKLVSCLKAHKPGDKLLAKRLETLIAYWQQQNDLVMRAWAHEAFSDHVSLPIQLPIEELQERHSNLATEYENELRNNDQLDLPDLMSMQNGLQQAEREWAKLTEYLNELPRPTTVVKLPENIYEIRELLSRVVQVWTDLDALNNADLRLEIERLKLDACRQTLRAKFDGIAIQAKLLQREQQLQPLTNLPYLQNRILEAAEKCGNDECWDEKCVFQFLADNLQKMITLFRRVAAEDGYLWRLVSAEYCLTVHARAGSLLPRPDPADLAALAEQFAELHDEDQKFARSWSELKNHMPKIPPRSAFEPEAYLDFLKRFPKDPPHSRRGYIQFKRIFIAEPMPTILSQSRRYLPEWICKYLDEGIPQYATEV